MSTETREQGVAVDRLETDRVIEELPRQLFELRDVLGRDRLEVHEQLCDVPARDRVDDVQAVALSGDELGALESLEVVRGVRYRLTDLAGEHLHRPRRLGQQLQELETSGARQRLPKLGEVGIGGVFEDS